MGVIACRHFAAMLRKARLQSVYGNFTPPGPDVQWYRLVQSQFHISRCSFIAWLACNNRLPPKDVVGAYNQGVDPMCVLCQTEAETLPHLFFECAFAREVVCLIMQKLGLEVVTYTLQGWIASVANARHRCSRVVQLRAAGLCACLYMIWNARNKRLFANVLLSTKTICFGILPMLRKFWIRMGIGTSRTTVEIGIALGLV